MKKAKIHFIASVDDAHMANMDHVAQRLRSKGCVIDHVFSTLGVITGSVKVSHSLDELKVEGIKNIEEYRNLKAF